MDIRPTDRVLEIGSGNNPHSRSNVLCDKYLLSDAERAGRLVADRAIVVGDGERLPFKDRSFDYVIAKQVVEHMDDPETCFREMMRVSRRGGYIETPTEFQERINPEKTFHKWLVNVKGRTLYLKPKRPSDYLGIGPITQYLYHHDKEFQAFYVHHLDLFIVRYEWERVIRYQMLPANADFFLDFGSEEFQQTALRPHRDRSWKRWVPPMLKQALLPLYSRLVRRRSRKIA
ncbi:MAG: class I SAM-dependent methyltransferase [Nitrospirota bacterium]